MYVVRRSLNWNNFGKIIQNYGAVAQNKINSSKTYYTYSPEPSQPLNRDPTFCSIEEAVKCVKSGKFKCISYI